MSTVHLDYETRCRADLREVGAHRYAIDDSFEILMAGVSRDGEDRVYLWVNPKYRTPEMMGDNEEAERILAEADIIYAHNAPFEQAATWGAESQDKPRPLKHDDLSKWRCTAAMARKAGLPWSLEKFGEALGLTVQKDKRGKALINLFSIPQEDGSFIDPRNRPEEWYEFGEYCKTDVRVEKQGHQRIKAFELTGSALDTFQFDLRMNQRGIPINVTAARNAQAIIDQVQSGVVEEFRALTGFNPTQGVKFKLWLATRGLKTANLQADTVSEILASDLPVGPARRALEMFQSVSYAAVKKVQTMLDCVCPDGRVRGTFVYYGAGTGRWTARSLQPQNFRKTDPEFREMFDAIYRAICGGISPEMLNVIYGSPLECIANIIRAFIHDRKLGLLDGDYSAIEARIICWLAGQDDVLAKWAMGEDIYKWMASHVYARPVSEIDADQREVGKRLILGCSYQMGWKKFQSSCKSQYGLVLDDDLCKRGVKTFRAHNDKIRAYWYFLQQSALDTVKTKHAHGPFSVRKIGGIEFLLFRLPSGRSLAYPHPKVELEAWVPEKREEEYGEESQPEVQYREQVTHWGEVRNNIWGRMKLYGGRLAENACQGTAADIMAHGALVAEARGMAPFMLVHDQGVALRTGNQTAEEYSAALAALPPWAKGLPIKVESKILHWWKK